MEWISVSDKLPDTDINGESDDVLIAVRYGYDESNEPYTICCGYLLGGNWWSYTEHSCNKIGQSKADFNFNPYDGDKVEYWMPLPKNPRPHR